MGFEVGQRIADYEIESLLGVGGMGRVYRVRNVISDRIEAMKVLLADLNAEPDLAARFLSEIRTLAGLDHPHIAQLRTALQTGNELVMVMEFVEGCTLQQLAQQTELSTPVVIAYAHQVLSALSYAHSRSVVHRDIKPANIMVTPQGSIKLTDFGIAKSKSKDELTRPGTTVGSLNYMAPEQALGGSLTDARSDIYSVGITLYELLVGRRPFEDESAYVVLHSQLNVVPRPPIEVKPQLSKQLSDVIMKALEKEPARRYQSAASFSEALHMATGISGAKGPESSMHAVPDAMADALSWFSAGEHRRLWLVAEVAAGLAIAAAAVAGMPHVWKHTVAAKATDQAITLSPAVAAPVASQPGSAPGSGRSTPDVSAESPVETVPMPVRGSPMVPHEDVRISRVKHDQAESLAIPIHETKQRANQEDATPVLETKVSASPANAAEVAEIRRLRQALDARANAVSVTVRRLRTVGAAEGDVLNRDVAGAYVDMNMNLSAEKADLEDGNVAAARGHIEKAAVQVSVLEKLLNDQKN